MADGVYLGLTTACQQRATTAVYIGNGIDHESQTCDLPMDGFGDADLEDDREEIVRERLEVYRRQTEPLVALYSEAGLLKRIDGNQTIEEVARQVLAAVTS